MSSETGMSKAGAGVSKKSVSKAGVIEVGVSTVVSNQW